MYIVYCSEVSSMGKRFDDSKAMGDYIIECLKKYPSASIKTELFI